MDDSPRSSSKSKDTAGRTDRPSAARPEFEVAYYTKELGRPLQRKMLASQLARLQSGGSGSSDGGIEAAQREDLSPMPAKNRTWDDRAG